MHFVVQSDKSDPEMIRALHKLGADVNAKTIKGRTPLHIAAQSENFEQVRMLLGCHADMTIANNDGMIPEQFVKYRPKMKILFKQEKNKRQVEKDIHKQKMRNVFDELKARNNKAS